MRAENIPWINMREKERMINDDNTVAIRISKDLYDMIVERAKRDYLTEGAGWESRVVDGLPNRYDSYNTHYSYGFSDGITSLAKYIMRELDGDLSPRFNK